MRSALLNRRLVLEAPLRVSDGAGGFRETWGALGQIWAAVRPRGAGREVDQAARLQLSILMRAAPQGAQSRPEAGMRFRDGQRLYRIAAVQEHDPSGRFLVCFAREEVGQ
jgi:head-tail adaptor